MIETFIRIEGYDNYEVSNYGDVMCTDTGRILKKSVSKGYELVVLSKKCKLKTYRIHRLVALAFIPNHDNRPSVDHIDSNRSNNVFHNLRWATDKENQMNRTISKNNTSGVKGVHFHSQRKKWQARYQLNGVVTSLGLFENIEDAKKARMKKANELFGEFVNACEKE